MKSEMKKALYDHTITLELIGDEGCDLVDHCIKHDRLSDLQWLTSSFKFSRRPDLEISQCAIYNRLNIMKWIHSQYPEAGTLDDDALLEAATQGYIRIIKYLHDKGAPLTDDLMGFALSGNHLKLASWLKAQGCPLPSYWKQESVFVSGKIAPIKWITQNYPELCDKPEIFRLAKEARAQEKPWISAWLKKYANKGSKTRSFIKALKNRALLEKDLLICVHQYPGRKYLVFNQLIDWCIKHDKLADLKWLTASFQIPRRLNMELDLCATYNRLNIMKWIHKMYPGIDLDESEAMSSAARVSNFEVLEYLYSKGACPESQALEAVLSDGNLKAADWLVKHHCPLDRSHWQEEVFENEDLKAVRWVLENFPDLYIKEDILAMARDAREDKHPKVARFLTRYAERNYQG